MPYVIFISTPIVIFAAAIAGSLFFKKSYLIDRYLISVIFSITALIAIGIDDLIFVISKGNVKNNVQKISATVCICISLLFAVQNLTIVTYDWCPYPSARRTYKQDLKGAAEYLLAQNDIYAPYTLVSVGGNKYHLLGMNYYFTRNNTIDSFNAIRGSDIPENILDYSIIYVMYTKSEPSSKLVDILNEHYTLSSDDKTVKVRKWILK